MTPSPRTAEQPDPLSVRFFWSFLLILRCGDREEALQRGIHTYPKVRLLFHSIRGTMSLACPTQA